MPNSGSDGPSVHLKPINLLSLVKTMNIKVSEVNPNIQGQEQNVSDFLKIKFMENVNNYGPVLQANPSILEYKIAPLAGMP